MKFARKRAFLIAAVIAIAAAAALLAVWPHPAASPRASAEKPTLLLLTSLPIIFGEDFSIEQTGSPALDALKTRYRVVPISVASPTELAKGRLLLMAHPLAQPAEHLVALDQWVRNGGRVLLLADPMLEWPSKRPLGDPLRPSPMFMDTGLLAHWRMRLDAPDQRGPKTAELAGYRVETVSPGSLYGDCATSADRLVARCIIGKGKATIIADADLLDVDDIGAPANANLTAILSELSALER